MDPSLVTRFPSGNRRSLPKSAMGSKAAPKWVGMDLETTSSPDCRCCSKRLLPVGSRVHLTAVLRSLVTVEHAVVTDHVRDPQPVIIEYSAASGALCLAVR